MSVYRTFNTYKDANRQLLAMQYQRRQVERQQLTCYQMASFSLRQNSNKNQSDYQKGFEDLMGSQKGLSEQEKKIIEEQMKAKQEAEARAQEMTDEAKQKMAEQNQQDFDDLLKGKTPSKKTEDMNLQEIFKSYYVKAKTVDKSDYLNSAKGSLNSFSSYLEKKRQRAKEQKEEKEAEQTATDKTQAAEPLKEEKKEQEAAQEKFTEATQEGEKEVKEEGAKEEAHAEQQQEEIKVPKVSLKEKWNMKMESISTTVEEKYPRVHKATSYFGEVWRETFPNDEKNVRSRIQRRKRVAMEQKKYTEEEIEAMQAEIPEWKRGGVVVAGDPVEEDEGGLLKRTRKKLGKKLAQTSVGQNLKESDLNKDLTRMRKEVQEFKGNLKEELDNTQNPFVQRSREVIDIAFIESGTAKAVKHMKAYDKEFNIEELPFEAEEVFKEFFCNFLSGNLEYIESVSSSTALALVKAELKRRKEEGWEYRYTDILDSGAISFLGGMVPDKQPPQFTFTLNVQEINCKQKIKEPSEIHEGSDTQILMSTYRFTLSRHQEPDIALTGHYWEIIEFAKQGELQQIV